jgi:beta-lactam-binding protein with PASTA domain
VPRVIGLTAAKAKVRIRKAHCAPGAVTRAYSRKKAGLVIGQKPAPGTRFARNHAVKLTVSRGPKHKGHRRP